LAECLDALFEVTECLARIPDLTDQEVEALVFQRRRRFRSPGGNLYGSFGRQK
jgi:hypothetical protein